MNEWKLLEGKMLSASGIIMQNVISEGRRAADEIKRTQKLSDTIEWKFSKVIFCDDDADDDGDGERKI